MRSVEQLQASFKAHLEERRALTETGHWKNNVGGTGPGWSPFRSRRCRLQAAVLAEGQSSALLHGLHSGQEQCGVQEGRSRAGSWLAMMAHSKLNWAGAACTCKI